MARREAHDDAMSPPTSLGVARPKRNIRNNPPVARLPTTCASATARAMMRMARAP
jgi:hypothetical protein